MDQRQPKPEECAKIAAAQTQDRTWHHSLEAHKGKSCQLTGLVLGHFEEVMDLTHLLPHALSSHGASHWHVVMGAEVQSSDG